MRLIIIGVIVLLFVGGSIFKTCSRVSSGEAFGGKKGQVAETGSKDAAGLKLGDSEENVPYIYTFKNRVAPEGLGKKDIVSNTVQFDIKPQRIEFYKEYFAKLDVAVKRQAVRFQLFEVRRDDGDSLALSVALEKFKIRIETEPVPLPRAGVSMEGFQTLLFQRDSNNSIKLMLDTQVNLTSGEPLSFASTGQQEIRDTVATDISVSTNTRYQDVGLTVTLLPTYFNEVFSISYDWKNSEPSGITTKTEIALKGSIELKKRPVVLLSNVRQQTVKQLDRFFFIPIDKQDKVVAVQGVLVITPIESVNDLDLGGQFTKKKS
jgi:hypothetical protein